MLDYIYFKRLKITTLIWITCRGAERVYDKSFFGLGSWNSTDILMDEVSCTGEEREFLSCPYTINHDCSVHEFVSVLCKENTGNDTGILAFLGTEKTCQLNEFFILSV